MASTPINERTLVKLLAVLSKKERKKFKKYLLSPLISSSPVSIALIEALERWLSGSQKKSLPFNQIQEELEIASSTLEKSLSQVLGLLRDFIREEALREQPAYDYGRAFEFLHLRDLDSKDLEIENRNYSKKLSALPESSERFYQELKLLEKVSNFRTLSVQQQEKAFFENYLVKLEEYYVTLRLKYICTEMNRNQIYRNDTPAPEIAGMVERLESMGGKLSTLGMAYFKAAYFLQEKKHSLEEMQNMMDFLHENVAGISRDDGYILYGFMINTCIRQMQFASMPFLDMVIEMYLSMIKSDLMVHNGFIESWHFRNYIVINLRRNQISIATQFYREYQIYLRDGEGETTIPEMGGHLNYKAKKFEDAIECFNTLLRVPNLLTMREILARLMIWRCYFELYDQLNMKKLDEMYHQCQSIRVFIQRDSKISEMYKERFSNFTRLFYKLIRRLDNPIDAERIKSLEALAEEVSETPNVCYHEWLLEEVTKRI